MSFHFIFEIFKNIVISSRLDAIDYFNLSYDRGKWNSSDLHARSCSCFCLFISLWLWPLLLFLAERWCWTDPVLQGENFFFFKFKYPYVLFSYFLIYFSLCFSCIVFRFDFLLSSLKPSHRQVKTRSLAERLALFRQLLAVRKLWP